MKTPKPLAIKPLELQNKALFYPSPILAASSNKTKNLSLVPSSEQLETRQESNRSSEHIVYR